MLEKTQINLWWSEVSSKASLSCSFFFSCSSVETHSGIPTLTHVEQKLTVQKMLKTYFENRKESASGKIIKQLVYIDMQC